MFASASQAWTASGARGVPWLGVALACGGLARGCSGTSRSATCCRAPRHGAGAAAASIGDGQVKVGAHPAVVGHRQCGGGGAVHAQRRRDGARRIQQPGHPAAGQGRRRQRPGRAAGRAAGARRRRRDHPRAAVRADGRSGRPGRARARRSGDRVLDRRQCRGARRLSPELPAGIRRRSHRRLCRQPRAGGRSPR